MHGFSVSELVPRGFVVESAVKDDDGFVIAIRGVFADARRAEAFATACTANIGDDWRIFQPEACG